IAQNLGQRIGKTSWLGESEHVRIGHGVSLLCWRSGGFEHPHDTPPYPFMPSPNFVHSSIRSGRTCLVHRLSRSASSITSLQNEWTRSGSIVVPTHAASCTFLSASQRSGIVRALARTRTLGFFQCAEIG